MREKIGNIKFKKKIVQVGTKNLVLQDNTIL